MNNHSGAGNPFKPDSANNPYGMGWRIEGRWFMRGDSADHKGLPKCIEDRNVIAQTKIVHAC